MGHSEAVQHSTAVHWKEKKKIEEEILKQKGWKETRF